MEFKSSLSKASTLLSQSGTSNGDSKDVYFAPEAMSDIQIVIDTKQDAKENLCLNLSSLDDDTKSAQSILITQFTDTEIKYEINDDGTQSCCVDAVRYHCHKQILSVASGWFYEIFTKFPKVATIHFTTSLALPCKCLLAPDQLLSFIQQLYYNRREKIDPQTTKLLLILAKYFRVDKLVEACETTLVNDIASDTPSNAYFHTLLFAQNYGLKRLYSKCLRVCPHQLHRELKIEGFENDIWHNLHPSVTLQICASLGQSVPPFFPGERVWAYWKRRDTYPGLYKAQIVKRNDSGSYHLQYDDGAVDTYTPEINIGRRLSHEERVEEERLRRRRERDRLELENMQRAIRRTQQQTEQHHQQQQQRRQQQQRQQQEDAFARRAMQRGGRVYEEIQREQQQQQLQEQHEWFVEVDAGAGAGAEAEAETGAGAEAAAAAVIQDLPQEREAEGEAVEDYEHQQTQRRHINPEHERVRAHLLDLAREERDNTPDIDEEEENARSLARTRAQNIQLEQQLQRGHREEGYESDPEDYIRLPAAALQHQRQQEQRPREETALVEG